MKILKKLVDAIMRLIFGRAGKEEANVLHYIYGAESLPVPMDATDESETLARLKTGDESARAKLIERNLRLVVYIARRFENTGVDVEDMISVGTIGLIKAVNSFDTEKKIKLATYASRCIENEILMHLRRVVRLKSEISLDEPLNVDWEGNELLLSDILGTEPDLISKDLESHAETNLLWKAIDRLNKREREIMLLRYGLGGVNEKTQKEVADMLGISQSYISRLEKKIISRLKKEIVLQVN